MDSPLVEDQRFFNWNQLGKDEAAIEDLFELTNLVSSGTKDVERFFTATVGAIYLNEVASDGLLPLSDFISLFAVGLK